MKIIIILLVFSFFIFSNKINAQLYSYTFYESTQSYSELTNAHLSTAIGDEGFEDIILPFKFFISYPYPDSLFSDNLRLFVNGLVQINTPFNSTTNLNDFSNPQISRVLAPFWDDLIADIQTEIKYKTTGDYPQRIFKIEWKNILAANGRMNFQLWLFEEDFSFEFHYGNMQSANTSATIGLKSFTGSFISVTPNINAYLSDQTSNNNINTSSYSFPFGLTYKFTSNEGLFLVRMSQIKENVFRGSNNQAILKIQILSNGFLTQPHVAKFDFSTNGTTNNSDLTNAKLYCTESSSEFLPINQFGSTVNNPSGNFSFISDRELGGVKYYWLTYDIPQTASIGNQIDAECNNIEFGMWLPPTTPDSSSPFGSRTIIDSAQIEYTFTITDEFNNSQELIIGKDPFGSDGLDPEFGEVVSPQVPVGQFGARFMLPTDSNLTTLKDIRFGCYWADGYSHNIDLSYVSGSSQLTIEWEWNETQIYFLTTVNFINPYNGNLLAQYSSTSGTALFNVPINLDKIKIDVLYNGTLSWEEYQLLNPNGSDTLVAESTYNINWWSNQLGPFFNLDVSYNGGLTWDTIATNIWFEVDHLLWNVPNIISDSCLIRVGNYPCRFDVSDNYFSIVQVTPVELLSFSSFVVDNDVTLNWTTATETNNSGFQIERRETKNERSEDWGSLGFVNGNGTTTETKSYSYNDENLSAGSYQYRLKQIDFDGTFEYSNTIEVEINPPAKFSLEQNFPNPFNPSTSIQYSLASRQFVTLKIFNTLGQEVETLVNEYQEAGVHSKLYIVNSALPSGVYLYQLSAGEYNEVKKMLLLK